MSAQVTNSNAIVPSRGYAAQLRSLGSTAKGTAADLTDQDSNVESAGTIKINFPSMPQEIDLTRVSEYTVHNNQALPDGFHVYKHTNPLEIPLSFELSATDREYVLDGPIGLLAIGAKLHALTLPIIQSNADFKTRQAPKPDAGGLGASENQQVDQADKNRSAIDRGDNGFDTSAPFYFPPACILNLVVGFNGGHGIRCVGYVSRASVKLRGPWLTATDGSFRNLPSRAQYDFTFVHAPSFTNDFLRGDLSSVVQTLQAGARDVFRSFYNTLDLSSQANLGYVGLENDFAAVQQATAATSSPAAATPLRVTDGVRRFLP